MNSPPTPPPTTAPAVAAPLPGPKAVAIAFAGSIEKGDAAVAKGLVPNDATHARWVEAAVALSISLKKLDATAVERFGEPGKAVTHNLLHLTDSAKALEQAQEKVEGDRAMLTVPGRPDPLVLTKVEGNWQLQIGPAAEKLPAQLALFDRLTRAADRTTQEVAAGAYLTADRAARAFAARVLEARLRAE